VSDRRSQATGESSQNTVIQYQIHCAQLGEWPELFDEWHMTALLRDLQYLRETKPGYTFVVRRRWVGDWEPLYSFPKE
jgi:hypothetical protein